MANSDTRGKLHSCPKCGMIFENEHILRTHNLWECTGPAMLATLAIDKTLAAPPVGTPAPGEGGGERRLSVQDGKTRGRQGGRLGFPGGIGEGFAHVTPPKPPNQRWKSPWTSVSVEGALAIASCGSAGN